MWNFSRCIEELIRDRTRRVQATLADINAVDAMYHDAGEDVTSDDCSTPTEKSVDPNEAYSRQQLASLRNERAHLATVLPTLVRSSSDDDFLSIDGDVGTTDDNREEYAVTFDLPGILRHTITVQP